MKSQSESFEQRSIQAEEYKEKLIADKRNIFEKSRENKNGLEQIEKEIEDLIVDEKNRVKIKSSLKKYYQKAQKQFEYDAEIYQIQQENILEMQQEIEKGKQRKIWIVGKQKAGKTFLFHRFLDLEASLQPIEHMPNIPTISFYDGIRIEDNQTLENFCNLIDSNDIVLYVSDQTYLQVQPFYLQILKEVSYRLYLIRNIKSSQFNQKIFSSEYGQTKRISQIFSYSKKICWTTKEEDLRDWQFICLLKEDL